MAFFPSPRVSQVDAHILDNELVTLLREQLISIFSLQENKWWTYNGRPELWNLILNLLVFRLTTWKNGASYGNQLQNLKYTDIESGRVISKVKKTLLLGFILGGYFSGKLHSYLFSLEDTPINQRDRTSLTNKFKDFLRENGATMVAKIEANLKILNLANFILFLINGKYPTLVHRVLGICLTPVVSDLLKFSGNNVNFEFQNRQLVWNIMTEFLIFVFPFLQFGKLKRMARKLLPSSKESKEKQFNGAQQGPFFNLPVSQCAICHQNHEAAMSHMQTKGMASSSFLVTNPCITSCGHLYCYVCLAAKFNAMENSDSESALCPRCGATLEWFRLYGVEEEDVDRDAILVDYESDSENEENDIDFKEEKASEREQSFRKGIGNGNSLQSDESDDESNRSGSYSEGDDIDSEMMDSFL